MCMGVFVFIIHLIILLHMFIKIKHSLSANFRCHDSVIDEIKFNLETWLKEWENKFYKDLFL